MSQMIDIKKIEVPKDAYRKYIDKGALDELAASIKEKGVLEPILVRPSNGHFLVIAGQRRFLASKQAGLKEVPCDIKKVEAAEALELSIIENVQRDNPNLLDEALGFKHLLKQGYTIESIAQKISKKIPYVLARLKIAELPAFVHAKIADGHLSLGLALLFTRLSTEGDMKNFLQAILNWDEISVKRASEELERLFGQNLKEAPFDLSKCMECPTRSANQKTLFPEIKDKEKCLNQHCFFEKMWAFHKVQADAWVKQGGKLITDQKEYNDIRNKGVELNRRREEYKKCKDCKDKVYVLVKYKNPYGGRGTEIIAGIMCPSQRCYWAGEKTERSTVGSSSGGSGIFREHSVIQHAQDMRNRFLWRILPERVKASKTLPTRFAIYQILKHNNPISDDKARFLRKYCKATDRSLYAAIASIPGDKLQAALLDAVLYSLRYTDSSVLIEAAPEAKVDVKKDFIIDEEYLRYKTKAQLTKIAGDLKIPFDEGAKKPMMIEIILKAKLKGFTTKDIDSVIKPYGDQYELKRDLGAKKFDATIVTLPEDQQKLGKK